MTTVALTATMATVTMATSLNSSFRFPPEISLDNNNFYTSPPETRGPSSHRAVIAPKKGLNSKSKKIKRPLTPTIEIIKVLGMQYLGTL